MGILNQERATMAENTIQQHSNQKGARARDEDLASQVSDLITDIAHLCQANSIGFSDAVERGLNDFDNEELSGNYGTVIVDSKPEPVPPVVMANETELNEFTIWANNLRSSMGKSKAVNEQIISRGKDLGIEIKVIDDDEQQNLTISFSSSEEISHDGGTFSDLEKDYDITVIDGDKNFLKTLGLNN